MNIWKLVRNKFEALYASSLSIILSNFINFQVVHFLTEFHAIHLTLHTITTTFSNNTKIVNATYSNWEFP